MSSGDSAQELAPGLRLEVLQRADRKVSLDVEVLCIDKRSVTVRALGQQQTLFKGDVLTVSLDLDQI